MTQLRAVIFDWRGTLVTTLTPQEWAGAAMERLRRPARPIPALEEEPPGDDTDAERHRAAYYRYFADAGLDDDLADALYAVESDPAHNHFAVDAVPVLRAIAAHGTTIAVLSDIHFDIRPAFTAAGLGDVVNAYILSFEHGVQKPDPAIFRLALDALGTEPEQTLMVGDRAGWDGAALDLGIPTLLLPPLTDPRQERLALAARLLDVEL
ncbi:HAD family hydrolase [Winogradskya consettensis]|uniref:Hydrolase n=1 Tax=Winogradskya consettensis TaxID=113560 RepID=A0A919W087_9ACTN|nr:HAD family hydrolase [Actinoplanes consettensis]GIM81227.1 hydrolase [Actinoplanes consettensis]